MNQTFWWNSCLHWTCEKPLRYSVICSITKHAAGFSFLEMTVVLNDLDIGCQARLCPWHVMWRSQPASARSWPLHRPHCHTAYWTTLRLRRSLCCTVRLRVMEERTGTAHQQRSSTITSERHYHVTQNLTATVNVGFDYKILIINTIITPQKMSVMITIFN